MWETALLQILRRHALNCTLQVAENISQRCQQLAQLSAGLRQHQALQFIEGSVEQSTNTHLSNKLHRTNPRAPDHPGNDFPLPIKPPHKPDLTPLLVCAPEATNLKEATRRHRRGGHLQQHPCLSHAKKRKQRQQRLAIARSRGESVPPFSSAPRSLAWRSSPLPRADTASRGVLLYGGVSLLLVRKQAVVGEGLAAGPHTPTGVVGDDRIALCAGVGVVGEGTIGRFGTICRFAGAMQKGVPRARSARMMRDASCHRGLYSRSLVGGRATASRSRWAPTYSYIS